MMKRLIAVALVVFGLSPASAEAQARWAVIVSGASGGEKYAEQMRDWREGLRSAMADFTFEKVLVLTGLPL